MVNPDGHGVAVRGHVADLCTLPSLGIPQPGGPEQRDLLQLVSVASNDVDAFLGSIAGDFDAGQARAIGFIFIGLTLKWCDRNGSAGF